MLLLALALSQPAAAADWKQLRAPEAQASSFLQSNWNKYSENYHPSYVLDGDPKTAWVEGVEGEGVGELLRVPLSPLRSAAAVKLKIRNGYQKSEKLFAANAAPAKVRVIAYDSAGQVSATTEVELTRTLGWQEVQLPLQGKGLAAVEMELLSVHSGSVYQDTCVSDVEVWVQSDEPYKAEVEQLKHARLSGWIQERQEVAAYFASKPAAYPFASTNYSWDSDYEAAKGDFEQAWAEAARLMAGVKDQGPWYKASNKNIPREPDGLWEMWALLPLMDVGEVSFFEGKEGVGRRQELREEEWVFGERSWSNVKLKKGPEGEVRAVYFTTRQIVDERITVQTDTEWVLFYDENGHLSSGASLAVTDDMDWGPMEARRLLRFELNDAGQITAIHARVAERPMNKTANFPDMPLPEPSYHTTAWLGQ